MLNHRLLMLFVLTAGCLVLAEAAQARMQPVAFVPTHEMMDSEGGAAVLTFATALRRREYKVDVLRVGSREIQPGGTVRYEELAMGVHGAMAYEIMPQGIRRVGLEFLWAPLLGKATERNRGNDEDLLAVSLGTELGVLSYLNIGARVGQAAEIGGIGGFGLHFGIAESSADDTERSRYSTVSAPLILGAYAAVPSGPGLLSAQGGLEYAPEYAELELLERGGLDPDTVYVLDRTKSLGWWISIGLTSENLSFSLGYHWGASTGFRLTFGWVG